MVTNSINSMCYGASHVGALLLTLKLYVNEARVNVRLSFLLRCRDRISVEGGNSHSFKIEDDFTHKFYVRGKG